MCVPVYKRYMIRFAARASTVSYISLIQGMPAANRFALDTHYPPILSKIREISKVVFFCFTHKNVPIFVVNGLNHILYIHNISLKPDFRTENRGHFLRFFSPRDKH